jgi:hypothetical protein
MKIWHKTAEVWLLYEYLTPRVDPIALREPTALLETRAKGVLCKNPMAVTRFGPE